MNRDAHVAATPSRPRTRTVGSWKAPAIALRSVTEPNAKEPKEPAMPESSAASTSIERSVG